MCAPRAVLAALLLLVATGCAMATYDTIVVGLGAAGAAAAGRLARAGRRVLALDAQHRLGGRVHTVPFGAGVVELGAEWVHGTEQSPVFELATGAGVPLLPQDLNFAVHFSDGDRARAELASELTAHMLQLQENLPERAMPLGQYLSDKLREYIAEKHPAVANDTAFVDSFLDFADLLVGNYEACDSWLDVTTQSNFRELGGHQHMSWHALGYSTLFQLLLNTFAGAPGYPTLEVKLGSEVTLIEWPQRAHELARVTTRDGAVYSARAVIVTLSVGVLKERAARLFSPALGARKQAALSELRMGLLDKVVLLFPSAWWAAGEFSHWCWSAADRRALPAADRWLARVTMLSNPLGERNALTVWFSGARAARCVGPVPAGGCCRHARLFSPALPARTVRPIERIAMGAVGKVVLGFERAFWPPDTLFFPFVWAAGERRALPPARRWLARLLGASCPRAAPHALTLWTSGRTARLVETLPDEEVRTKLMWLIRKFMGTDRNIPEPVAMLRSSWHSNPFTRGSYTYDDVRTPEHPTARADLAEPLLDDSGAPRLLFAGEATHPTHFSTVHGAVATGYREAARLLPASKM